MPVLSQVRPPTGEPDAGEPHVRFGGRGYRNQSTLPTPVIFLHRRWTRGSSPTRFTHLKKRLKSRHLDDPGIGNAWPSSRQLSLKRLVFFLRRHSLVKDVCIW